LDAVESDVVRASELTASQQEQLKVDSDPSIVERATELLTLSATNEAVAGLIEEYSKSLSGERDAANGKMVFEKTCLNCHKLGDAGHEIGPALGSIINKPDEAILADILDPSSKVDSEFTSYSVVTESGRIFTGVLASESPTSVTLKMEKGLSETILRNEIDVIRASRLSLMPADLHKQISPTAMADLLAYIREAYPRSRSK
jgi:putative heme-binding domain-containing protein